jgi:hypothetical protein
MSFLAHMLGTMLPIRLIGACVNFYDFQSGVAT